MILTPAVELQEGMNGIRHQVDYCCIGYNFMGFILVKCEDKDKTNSFHLFVNLVIYKV